VDEEWMTQLMRSLVAANAKILEVSAEEPEPRSQIIHIDGSAQAKHNLSKHVPPTIS
jgi:hypothetical protein